MLLPLLAAIAALQASPGDTVPAVPAAVDASAYLDADARSMVRQVRERRASVEHSITSYRTTARERISVGLRAMQRDRVLFRKETAARVHWIRDGVGHIEMLGARQVVPVALPKPSLPDDLREDAPDLAFDPRKDFILRSFDDNDDDDDFFRHPLVPGSEVDYRFRSGDTTTLRLSPQRTLRVLELRVIPRRVDARLLQGSFWFDAETHAPVRASFRLARPVDLERDLGEDDDDIPGLVKPIRGELRYVTIDYGLWEQRWWLPRLIALEVVAQAGNLLNIPVSYERSYTDYSVTGEAAGANGDSAAQEPSVEPGDSSRIFRSCRKPSCSRFVVDLPADSTQLLVSEHLPHSIYAEGESLITEGELRELGDVLGVSPTDGRAWKRPEVQWRYLTPDLLRFNRVEGLAIGGRVDVDAGALAADARLWLATADPQLTGEVGVSRGAFDARYRVAAYRRLAAVEPDPRALGFGGSLSALLLGRDDGDYFRTLGAELSGESVGARGSGYHWRLFAERQSVAEKSTDFSLPRLFDSEREFAPNIAADEADQIGVTATYRLARGLNPLGFRWRTEAVLGAETGSYRVVRPSLSAYAGFPLPRSLVGAVEVAGGTAFGEVPLQRQWFLGGPSTVRGFGGGSRIHGSSYWRGRAEVASAFPGARVVLFSDAGWAGARSDLGAEPSLLSAGLGVSFLDGLIRADVARALRGGSGWRLDLHLDAPI